MGKWTKGPWNYGEDMRGRNRVFAPDGREIVRALSTHGTRRLPLDERTANARLIAAAPALYDALHEMTEIYWGVDDDKNGDGISPPPKCIVRARAALASAKGTAQGETR